LQTAHRNPSAPDAKPASASESPAPLDRIVTGWRESARDAAHSAERAPGAEARFPGAARRIVTIGILLATALALSAPAAQAVGVNETKSEMLWNIAKFVQWPDASLASSKGQIVFTILGEDDLAASLANLLSTKTINGKPVYVRFARRAQDARGSQILYVASSETAHLTEVLVQVANAPVLTVADTPAFTAHGGMVGFAEEGGRVRFEINLGHAERNGLHISAKLLALARVVNSDVVDNP
jgi:hypothetical protein